MCVCEVILEDTEQSILKKRGKNKKIIIPWLTKQCDTRNMSQNKTFKILKRNHSFQNCIEDERLQCEQEKKDDGSSEFKGKREK